jgi:hypothetical protein
MKRNNINYYPILIAVILLCTSFSIFTVAKNINSYEQISMTYSFDQPIIKQIMIGNDAFTRITIQDLSASGNSGEPRLPSSGAYILLPQGTIVDEVTVESEGKLLGTGFNVEPIGKMLPISKSNTITLPVQDEDIYSSYEMFPGKLFEEIGIYSFRGYQILVLKLHPIQYIPAEGKIYFYKDIEISVNLGYDGNINPLFRNLEKDKNKIIDKVDNPEVADTYNHPVNKPINSNDLLIITTDSMKSAFETLSGFHNENGLSTIIRTTSEIGSSNPDVIRNYILDAYNNLLIDYVIIGADDDIIPAKDLFVRTVWWWPWSETEENMPSDIYYACLDGPYDNNGNGFYGEPDDGTGGGDVDLVADIYVGRASVGNNAEVNNFVSKTIQYLYSNDPYLDDVLLAGEMLNNAPLTWGGTYMDQLINSCTANGYTTIGIPSSKYNIDKLYERDGYWYASDLIEIINNGIHFINHLGHADYYSGMKLSTTHISSLTNEKLCFVYSQGCNSGGFDNGDCVAEYFNIKTDNAAFAVIMNARYGWYLPGGTDASSQHYHREFWDAVFKEGKSIIGAANHDSKEDNLFRINDECMRWSYYALNLFGDPSVNLLDHYSNTAPTEPPISGPNSGKPGKEYDYILSTYDAETHDVYYYIDWGDGSFMDWDGPYSSEIDVTFTHTWDEEGTFIIKAKARDEFYAESDWFEFEVNIPRARSTIHSRILILFEQFMNRSSILNIIFGF